MGKSQYLNLQDAALISKKSPQTIRRLIKGNNVRYRKYKTPQGFTYLVEKNSLLNRFDEEDEMNDVAPRRNAAMREASSTIEESELVEEFDPASVVEVGGMHSIPQERPFAGAMGAAGNAQESSVVSQLIQQHREDKKRLFELLEIFQKRILTLEDQLKQLEAPKTQKRWWSFWK